MKYLSPALGFLSTFILVISPNGVLFAQASEGATAESTVVKGTPATPASTQQTSKPNTLLDGTPIKLRLKRTLSSADARVGQQVDFEVLEELKVNDALVIPKGAVALGTVTAAEPKRRLGRGGKLDINLDSVRLVDSEKASLRATTGGNGGGHTGAMIGAMAATALFTLGGSALFLLMHGKDITIPDGTELTAYVNGDMPLDPSKFSFNTIAASSNAVLASSEVAIDATQPNCEIEVDGSFVGNTPSKLSLAQGRHEITVKKRGFSQWTKTIMISGPSVHLQAEVDAAAPLQAAPAL